MQCEEILSPENELVIRPVSGRKELRRFITLPRHLYEGMTGYTAPLDMVQESLLDPRKSAVFRHADIQYFMAWRNGRPVGRIAAVVDHRAIEHWGEKIGVFGAFDALPEKRVVAPLLEAARAWLRERGMTRMRGPVTLSGNGESGLMIEGQQAASMIAMPWHPAGLDALVQEAGFHPTEDLLSYRLELSDETEKRFHIPGNMKVGEGRLGSIAIRHLSKNQIAAQGEILRRLYNDAWADKYNFVPMQEYEIQALIRELKPLLRPEHYVQIDQNGEAVAMALVMPNLFDVSADLGGSPSPLGWAKLLFRLTGHRFHSARVILLGVTSKLRGTVLGSLLPSLAIAELLKRRHKVPYSWVELGWIQASDKGMRNLAESLVSDPYKRYRLYERETEA